MIFSRMVWSIMFLRVGVIVFHEVNSQYVWREFWAYGGCASSQLVRSNILQALFATPLFKGSGQHVGRLRLWNPFCAVHI